MSEKVIITMVERSVKKIHEAINLLKVHHLKCDKCRRNDVTIMVKPSGWVGYCDHCKSTLTDSFSTPKEAADSLIECCRDD